MSAYYAGVDLGGTKIAGGILDSATGSVLVRGVIPTNAHEGYPAVMQRVAQLVRDLSAQAGVPLCGVGFGVPAVIDFEGGRTLLMPNLPKDWYGQPVVAELRQALNIPVALVNDARAFTLAEATLGAGRGADTAICYTIGTGIGGGIAFGGRLHLGLGAVAGELGHQTIEPDGPLCGCGNHGCLEALASGYAITHMGVQAARENPASAINTLVAGNLDAITPLVIMHAAEKGDPAAIRILERAGRYIGIGVANTLTILSADCVVIGGGVSQLGDWLLNPIRAVVRERCHTIPVDQIRIVLAALGQDAGWIGAAVWASQQIPPEGTTL